MVKATSVFSASQGHEGGRRSQGADSTGCGGLSSTADAPQAIQCLEEESVSGDAIPHF
jgi:hypothetical protein